jgi:hypothetical protein
VALIFDSFPEAGAAEGLAGVAAADDVDGFDLVPVGGGEVAEVGYAGHAVGDDLFCAGVDVGDPREVAAEHALHGLVEAAVAGAQGADADRRPCTPREALGRGRCGKSPTDAVRGRL